MRTYTNVSDGMKEKKSFSSVQPVLEILTRLTMRLAEGSMSFEKIVQGKGQEKETRGRTSK